MELLKWCRGQWDRVAASVAFVAAAVLLAVGYNGVSNSEFVSEQVCYLISAGFTALLLVAVGATLWLSADLRDEWRKLHRVELAVRGTTDRDVLTPTDDASAELARRVEDLERALADLEAPVASASNGKGRRSAGTGRLKAGTGAGTH